MIIPWALFTGILFLVLGVHWGWLQKKFEGSPPQKGNLNRSFAQRSGAVLCAFNALFTVRSTLELIIACVVRNRFYLLQFVSKHCDRFLWRGGTCATNFPTRSQPRPTEVRPLKWKSSAGWNSTGLSALLPELQLLRRRRIDSELHENF